MSHRPSLFFNLRVVRVAMATHDIGSYTELAELAALSVPTIRQMVRGAIPGPKARAAIAAALGVAETEVWTPVEVRPAAHPPREA